jgi:hypothetical protein
MGGCFLGMSLPPLYWIGASGSIPYRRERRWHEDFMWIFAGKILDRVESVFFAVFRGCFEEWSGFSMVNVW